jgi:hypothetical protein
MREWMLVGESYIADDPALAPAGVIRAVQP